jgi:hypothetical protein
MYRFAYSGSRRRSNMEGDRSYETVGGGGGGEEEVYIMRRSASYVVKDETGVTY